MRDLADLKAAADKAKPTEVFMTAPSPGILTRFIVNLHYPTEDAYVEALADAMKTEYRAIVEAGFVLQIDCPDLGSARNNQYRHLSDDEFRKIAERNIARSTAPSKACRPTACACTSAGATTRGRTPTTCRSRRSSTSRSRRACRRSASRRPTRATTTSGRT
jgi:hypothetical protein